MPMKIRVSDKADAAQAARCSRTQMSFAWVGLCRWSGKSMRADVKP
jgi:hypothetical protein